MIKCLKCGVELDKPIASISGGIMGDEYIDAYFHCPHCDLYTVLNIHDRFLGDTTEECSGPLTKEEGDKKIAIINRCPTTWDKKCRCPAHLEYFGQNLD